MGGGTREFGITLGALLAGTAFNTWLYGVVVHQYITYYYRGFNDPLWIKTSVRILLIVDTLHSAVLLYVPWHYLVANYNAPKVALDPTWALLINPFFESISAALTQNFLTQRLFKLNRRRKMRRLLQALIVIGFFAGMVAGARPFYHDTVTWDDVQRLHTLYTVWFSIQCATDIIISISLFWEFRSYKTGETRSDQLLRTLTRKTIQAGGFATLFSCGASWTLSYAWKSTGLISAAFAICLPRVYTNALMDTLIMRYDLREVFMGVEPLTDVVARGLDNVQTVSRGSVLSTDTTSSTDSIKDKILSIV